jgi:hypothetical protein
VTKGRIETAKLRVESLIQDDIQVCFVCELLDLGSRLICYSRGRAVGADRGSL